MEAAKRLGCALFCVLAPLAGTVPAQDTPPPVPPELRARFGFIGPTIHKLGFGMNHLQLVAMTGDKGEKGEEREKGEKLRILVNNPHRARLEFLTWEPEEGDEHGTLQVESRSTSGDLHGLTMADVDGDGKLDLVSLNTRGRLVVQRGDKSLPELPELEIGPGAIYDCLRCADIDGDQQDDAVILTRSGLRIVTRIANKPQVTAPEVATADRVVDFHLMDLDGDGRLDLVLGTNAQNHPLQWKPGRGDGSFGPWVLLPVEPLVAVFPGTHQGGRTSLAVIHHKPHRVVEYALRKDGTTDSQQAVKQSNRPALHWTPMAEQTSTPAFAYGDVDGDGDGDLVLAEGDKARLTILLEEGGQFRATTTPCLAGVNCIVLADLDGDGKLDWLMTSPEEDALAIKYGKDPMEAFPQRLPIVDKPVAVAVDGADVLVLCRDKNRKAKLYRLQQTDGAWGEPQQVAELERLSKDPQRMLLADLDGVHGRDLAFVVPGDGLHLLFAKGDGTFEKRQENAAGFTKNIKDGATSLVNTDQGDALMVVCERYVRRCRFDEKGEPVILQQDNGPEGIQSMSLGAHMQDGSRLYLDGKNNLLHRQAPGQPDLSLDVPPITPSYLFAHGDSALVLGVKGVLRIPFGSALELETLRTHEPPTKDTRYFKGIAADVDGDQQAELILLDQDLSGMHILVATPDQLQRALSAPIFEQKENKEGYEPRALVAGDVDGDGRQDLVFLAHDRILIYRQEL